jgi:hypothetical protein
MNALLPRCRGAEGAKTGLRASTGEWVVYHYTTSECSTIVEPAFLHMACPSSAAWGSIILYVNLALQPQVQRHFMQGPLNCHMGKLIGCVWSISIVSLACRPFRVESGGAYLTCIAYGVGVV